MAEQNVHKPFQNIPKQLKTLKISELPQTLESGSDIPNRPNFFEANLPCGSAARLLSLRRQAVQLTEGRQLPAGREV